MSFDPAWLVRYCGTFSAYVQIRACVIVVAAVLPNGIPDDQTSNPGRADALSVDSRGLTSRTRPRDPQSTWDPMISMIHIIISYTHTHSHIHTTSPSCHSAVLTTYVHSYITQHHLHAHQPSAILIAPPNPGSPRSADCCPAVPPEA